MTDERKSIEVPPFVTHGEFTEFRGEVRQGFAAINEQLRTMLRPQYSLLVSGLGVIVVLAGMGGALVSQLIASESTQREAAVGSLTDRVLDRLDGVDQAVELLARDRETERRDASAQAVADAYHRGAADTERRENAHELDLIWSELFPMFRREGRIDHAVERLELEAGP
jgi:hypothetical protein